MKKIDNYLKTCDLFMSFCTIFWKVIWDENWVNKLLIGLRQFFLSQLRNVMNFRSKISYQRTSQYVSRVVKYNKK